MERPAFEPGAHSSHVLLAAEHLSTSAGLEVVDVADDGNCMLRAVLVACGMPQASHVQLRTAAVFAVAQRMHLEPDLVLALAADLEREAGGDVSITSANEYLDCALQPGFFLGYSELAAAARLLQARFVVHSCTAAEPCRSSTLVIGEADHPAAHLLHVDRVHYMALVPSHPLPPLSLDPPLAPDLLLPLAPDPLQSVAAGALLQPAPAPTQDPVAVPCPPCLKPVGSRGIKGELGAAFCTRASVSRCCRMAWILLQGT